MHAQQFESHIVKPYSASLFKLAVRIVHDVQTAEDIVQECFLKLWEKREKLSTVLNLKAYTARMVYTSSIDWVRCQSQFQHLADPDLYLQAIPDSTPLEQDIHQLEAELYNTTFEHIQACMRSWSPEDQTLFHLRVYENTDYLVIAQILGGESGKYRTRYSRLLQSLKHALQSQKSTL